MVGPLFFEILKTQFEALRDGDRFWYQNALAPDQRDAVERTRLADIIRRNTDIADEIGPDVFRVPSNGGPTRRGSAGGLSPRRR